MIGEEGPFRVCPAASNSDEKPPLRHYNCEHYTACLNLAAALNWDSFTCDGCSGQVSQALCWQARQAQKKDAVAGRLCQLPEITSFDSGKGKVA